MRDRGLIGLASAHRVSNVSHCENVQSFAAKLPQSTDIVATRSRHQLGRVALMFPQNSDAWPSGSLAFFGLAVLTAARRAASSAAASSGAGAISASESLATRLTA